MTRGNPDFIASGWGEPTKAVKLPIRIAERIQELRDDGEDADSILTLLENDDSRGESEFDLDEVTQVLQEALELKANAGGKIKTKIRKVLELLGAEEE
jgi:hypothetical protein